jgi:hypothetical protein
MELGMGTSIDLPNFDLATLDTLLRSDGINAGSPIADINRFLISHGDTTGIKDSRDLISVMTGTPPFPTNQPVQVDDITTAGTYSINTDQYPLLQALILDDSGGAQNLTVTGDNSVLIATGDGENTITLQDHGNDTIVGSGGGDTVDFSQQDYHHGHGISISTSHAGITTVSFADTGQDFRISGVQTLTFAHGHVVHL